LAGLFNGELPAAQSYGVQECDATEV